MAAMLGLIGDDTLILPNKILAIILILLYNQSCSIAAT